MSGIGKKVIHTSIMFCLCPIYIYKRDGPGGGPIFLVILYFIFVIESIFPNQFSQLNSNSNYSTKKLNKNNKNINNGNCILAKNYFTTKKQKKSYVIGEAKTKFFTITVY